ncbi:alpha/beta hydrolase [Microbacterium sp. M3]|uniref:Alpha/beta hydrolase n=1 Tax=Microbacterium arthrosphaerae TaxID=792652 RepID=A0ABU4GXI8_9MICO|nr:MULTISPECIES: alpha/beta hydrolase [Microbacterium]MDW4571776.1 alpha/beta hydrolase [Microbacterium arthrosphaerae]MDW7605631.1 alpha/beta hydrolase [Microbacterium sp. M3]
MARTAAVWAPDVLGTPFEQQTLPLGVDGEHGPLVATLVRSIPNPFTRLFAPLRDVDVLYVHGWSDYFFQRELARFWTARGATFYALDLRRYGRSLRDGEVPGYIDSLDDYDADIAAALAAMGQGERRVAGSGRRLVLLGHSTGGLTLTLWAARHPGRAAALILNSPWLELQLGALGRQALAPLVDMRARIDPRGTQPAVDFGFYTRAQQEIGSLPDGDHRARWRPDRGFATAPGWLSAVMQGHRRIAAGVDVECPALVLLSARSTPPLSWKESMTSSDSVLVVDDIARAATRIGGLVTIARIDGAIHDVFLSRAQPRAEAYDELDRWVDGYVAAGV